MKTKMLICLTMTLATFAVQAAEMVDYIDPMIGCYARKVGKNHGLGKTFPGPATPFGLVQLSPDTITGGDYGSGYCWTHDTIEGFSFTHMSGVGWFGDLGNFQVMPTTGPLQFTRSGNGGNWSYTAKSNFSHDKETVKAGYYAVELERYGIKAELTAAPRAGIMRFTYPKAEQSRIQIDLARRIGMKKIAKTASEQMVEVVDDHTIQGYMQCSSKDGGWGRGSGNVSYTVYFYAQFSKPLEKFGGWELGEHFQKKQRHIGRNAGFYVEFPTTEGEQVLLKSGISFVSVAGAKANLEHDIPDWDFDAVYKGNRALWSKALDGVAIKGATEEQKTVFATSLYHAFIDPRSVSDIDGQYTGADGNAHRAEGYTYRSIFSGWDVYRSQFPLLTLLRPDVVNDQVNTFIDLAEQSGKGYLPRWELLNAYSGCMHGDPAVVVIAEAYNKGIRNYDVDRAYALCRQNVLGVCDNIRGRGHYLQKGYSIDYSISGTLEMCYADSALARFASALDKSNDATALRSMAQNYRKIFDPSVGNMRGRDSEGNWLPWSGLTKGPGCAESNPYQQGWFVPHDVQGLIELMGGATTFTARLEDFFAKTDGKYKGWNSYYNHANEPVHQVPYMFVHAGAPWLTQKWVRTVLDKAYGTGVKGLCGNEDVGQMSAWYVLSAMGLHPVDPASGIYIVGSPLFDEVSVRLDPTYYKGGKLTITAKNNTPKNVYIQSLKWNGKALNRAWMSHQELVKGGTLELVMGPEPNYSWATDPASIPPDL